MPDEGFMKALEFLFQHSADWRLWVGLVVTTFACCLWRAKRFRFVIEYQSKD